MTLSDSQGEVLTLTTHERDAAKNRMHKVHVTFRRRLCQPKLERAPGGWIEVTTALQNKRATVDTMHTRPQRKSATKEQLEKETSVVLVKFLSNSY